MSFNPELWVKRNETYLSPSSDVGLLLPASHYINFGQIYGALGYGIRDNAGTMQFKHNLGAWADLGSGGGGGITDGDKGDITVTATGATWTIDPNVVTNAKLAQMANKTYKGRTSALTGNAEDVPVATLKTDLALTKADVGLGAVDNTTDLAKPISTATQTALDLKQNLSAKDAANGYAGLDSNSKINPAHLPALAISDTSVVASQVAQLALTAEVGDIAVRTDQNKSYILRVSPATVFANWQELLTPTDTVQSVFSRTGVVTAQNGDYTAGQITNVPAGTISAVTVQLALNELDTEKSAVGHTHTLANVTDVTITPANLNSLDDGVDSTLHFHASDRARANHTGSQLSSTISDFASTVLATVLTGLSLVTSTAVTAADSILVAIGKLQKQNTDQDTAIALNTAKVTNATHTGDATGATALTLATVNTNVGSFTNSNVTVNAKGLVTAISNGTGGGNTFNDEYKNVYPNNTINLVPTGTVNGVNTVFSVDQAIYIAGTTEVERNGQEQTLGASADYTESNPATGQITFNVAPSTADVFKIKYKKSVTNSDTIMYAPKIANIAINTTAGAVANTDYVYFTTATLTLTLPTAVGNTNRYTIKCVAGTLTIDGAGVETIDGTLTISVAVEDSVDLISNGTEWKVV